MNTTLPTLAKLRPDPHWVKLPLFDRKGWRTVRFGDVVRMLKEQVDPVAEGVERYVAGEHMETENVHIRKWGNVGDGYLGPALIRRFRKGQVLYGSRRTYLKKVALAEWDGVTANTTFVLEAVEGKLLQKLLPWLMLSERFTKHSIQESKGSTNPYINFPDIAKFEFALPPLDQQRRIAEILWSVDEELNSFLEVRTALETFRKSLFGKQLAVFEAKPLSQVADFLDGKRVPLSEKMRAKRKGPYPYYGASGVIDSVDDFLFAEPLVLLSEDGFNLVNRTSRIAFKVEGKVWVNNHAHVLRPSPGMNIDFLADYLESISVEPYITGTYQRKLNKSECERIPIPFPPPAVQENIAATIARSAGSISAINNHIAASRDLVSALLSQISEDCR